MFSSNLPAKLWREEKYENIFCVLKYRLKYRCVAVLFILTIFRPAGWEYCKILAKYSARRNGKWHTYKYTNILSPCQGQNASCKITTICCLFTFFAFLTTVFILFIQNKGMELALIRDELLWFCVPTIFLIFLSIGDFWLRRDGSYWLFSAWVN